MRGIVPGTRIKAQSSKIDARSKTVDVTYKDENDNNVTPEDFGNMIDKMLSEMGGIFVTGSDGHRYLVNVAVTFVRSD
jgi:hypothetical protein